MPVCMVWYCMHILQKFQELKARREKECGKTTEKRKAAIKNKALRAGIKVTEWI